MPEKLCSPVSFLASFLCAEEAPHTLFLISGESGAGKTAWCLQLIQEAPRAGLQPCGLVSPPVFENGEKVGIDLLDVVSGERRRLAGKKPSPPTPPPIGEGGRGTPRRSEDAALAHLPGGEGGMSGPVTESWRFDATVLAWGDQVLAGLRSQGLRACDLLLLDELGPLEFERSAGLSAGLRLVDERLARLTCVVVRPALLPVAISRWPWGQVLMASTQERQP